MGSTFFSNPYEGTIDPEGFYQLSDSVRAGVAILYFTIEMMAAFLLVADWNYRGRIRRLTLFIVALGMIVAVGKMKRLELATPILALLGFIYLDKSKALYKPALLLVALLLVISAVGTYRLGLGFGLDSLLAVPLEANLVVNSLYRVIDLIDNNGYPFTYAIELLALPASVIPSLFLPDKHLLVDVGPLWADRLEVNPTGGYYGLAHLYRYGGFVAVIVISALFGLTLGYLYRRFLKSFDGSKFTSVFYPVIMVPLLFHYVRDDVIVAIKLTFQTGILLLLLAYIARLIRRASRPAIQNS